MMLADQIKPSLGLNVAFVISFLPNSLMIFGALTITEDAPGRFERFVVLLGVLGAALVVPLQLWGAAMLAFQPHQRDHSLKLIRVVIGLVVAVAYVGLARKWTAAHEVPAALPAGDDGPWSHE